MNTTTKPKRRMARPATEASASTLPVEPATVLPAATDDTASTQTAKAVPTKVSRLDQLQALLTATGGASIAEMTAATGWQAHSVRGAMAGTLKKRGVVITSEKIDGVRRYRATVPA